MSPAHVLEPTYQRLKHGLLNGAWAQEARLEAQRLAEDFGVSMTPVRDSLNRLVGEGLVHLKPGEGYRVPRLTERELRDMLELNLVLLKHALEHAVPGAELVLQRDAAVSHAEVIGVMFRDIAKGGGNAAVTEAVAALNDRLHPVRLKEAPFVADEIRSLNEAWPIDSRGVDPFRAALHSYHEKCQRCSAELVALLD